MTLKKWALFWIGLLLLNAYVNIPSHWMNLNSGVLAVLFLLYFAIAYLVAKATGLNGFKSLGLNPRHGAARELGIGAALGITFWLLLYAVKYSAGSSRSPAG